MIARDPAVLDRFAPLGLAARHAAAPDAPVWRMDTFRDRFLAAFSQLTGHTEPREAPRRIPGWEVRWPTTRSR